MWSLYFPKRTATAVAALVLLVLPASSAYAAPVDLGNLTNYLFFFANGSQDANWAAASKGYTGDVAIDGIQADERTSGNFAFDGTIYTNDNTLGAWQAIVDNNPGQATASTGNVGLIAGLESNLTGAFSQINALSATAGFTSVSSTSLDGLNAQNGVAETYVINITSGFSVSSIIDIRGDSGDTFILRWDTDANFANGYGGQVKFQSGGCINPQGALTPGNFINVAGEINSSGGGDLQLCTGLAPYLANVDAINDGEPVSGGGAFTGYWLTTGDPTTGDTEPLSNAIFVGGWYTTTDKFSLVSGSSGAHVGSSLGISAVPEPTSLVLIATGLASLVVARRRRRT